MQHTQKIRISQTSWRGGRRTLRFSCIVNLWQATAALLALTAECAAAATLYKNESSRARQNTQGLKLNSTGAQTHEVFNCCVRQQRFESPPAHVLHFQGYLFAGFASHCLLVHKQAGKRVRIRLIPLPLVAHPRTGRNNVLDNGANDFVQYIMPCRFVADGGVVQVPTQTTPFAPFALLTW